MIDRTTLTSTGAVAGAARPGWIVVGVESEGMAGWVAAPTDACAPAFGASAPEAGAGAAVAPPVAPSISEAQPILVSVDGSAFASDFLAVVAGAVVCSPVLVPLSEPPAGRSWSRQAASTSDPAAAGACDDDDLAAAAVD